MAHAHIVGCPSHTHTHYPPPVPSLANRKPAISFIFITLLLDVLGFGLLIPVGPRLVEKLQAGTLAPGTNPEAAAAPIVAMLAATYAFMQFVFAPLLGMLSDRFGRRPVLLVSTFGSALDYIAMALAPTIPWLFVTRAVNGLSGASMTAASAYIADVTPPEKRAAGFGIIGAAFGLGFILGPLLGGVLGSPRVHIPFIGPGDVHYPFYAAAGVTMLNWLYGYFVLPESLPKELRRPPNLARANPVGALLTLSKYPFVLIMAGSFFALNLAQFSLHTTWVLYTKHRYAWDELAAGLSLFAVGLGSAIVQGGLTRVLIPKLGEPRALLVGLSLGIAAYTIYGASSQGWMIYLGIAVGAIAGIGMPAAQSLITRSVPPDQQGTIQGGMTSLQSVANILGPLMGGGIFAYSISDDVNLPGLVYFNAAFLALLGLGIAAWALRTRTMQQKPDV
jgi:MFS transporter, DHA1 family, tetracycline resistance protein